MPHTHLNTRWGGRIENPTTNQMRSALADLAIHDAEHPDCWLSDEIGWTVIAYEGGKVAVENIESGEGPWHLVSTSPETALQLWLALQRGDVEAIRKQKWNDGYG